MHVRLFFFVTCNIYMYMSNIDLFVLCFDLLRFVACLRFVANARMVCMAHNLCITWQRYIDGFVHFSRVLVWHDVSFNSRV